MITTTYNPSPLEIELAQVIMKMKEEISESLGHNTIKDIEFHTEKDNPDLVFKLEDNDGDKHEIVVKFIQRADKQ